MVAPRLTGLTADKPRYLEVSISIIYKVCACAGRRAILWFMHDRTHQQAKFLDEAYTELDAEFPGLQDLLNGDRSSYLGLQGHR